VLPDRRGRLSLEASAEGDSQSCDDDENARTADTDVQQVCQHDRQHPATYSTPYSDTQLCLRAYLKNNNRTGFKRGQTGQLPRASTSRGPPQKTVKNIT